MEEADEGVPDEEVEGVPDEEVEGGYREVDIREDM